MQKWVLCCVKKSPRKDSQQRQVEVAGPAAAAAPAVSSGQARHDGAFEIGGEYREFKRRAVADTAAAAGSVRLNGKSSAAFDITTAANCSARPFSISDADCSATPLVHLPAAAAEASPKAVNYASPDQIMPSSAVDQQLPPPCSDNWWTEEMPNDNIFYPSEAYELDMILAEVAATAEHHLPPLSGQEGDQRTASAIYIGDLGWMTLNSGYSPPPPAFNWEPSPSEYQLWPEDQSDV